MSFSHEDVQRLLQLLDSSHFDELHLEAEGVKLSLRRGGATSSPDFVPGSVPRSVPGPVAPVVVPALTPKPQPMTPSVPVTAAPPATSDSSVSSDTTLLEIRAPMLGTYYGAPKPGAAPFVTVGARVSADAAVGIIEVMKLMNSIPAGVDGVLVEVLARDGELVEFDQVLMRVRPA